ncbi:MAG: ATP-binding protein [Candidatus Natronoplasma sp.]
MYSEEELLDELNRQNPWWNTGEIELEDCLIERDLAPVLKEELKKDIITALIGLRRTGKTTLMKQLIYQILSKTSPENVFYFSFDAMQKEERIVKKVIQLYYQNILKEVPEELEQKIFIFLDEVQKIDDWSEQVKSIWDRDYPIKFVISGSSSMNVTKGAGESLVGRIKIHRIHPFSFSEFVRYNEVKPPDIDLTDVKKDGIKYPPNSEKIKIVFKDYMEYGGFSEVYQKKEKKEYLNDIVSLTFYRDIINMLPVKRSEVLEGLFHHFISESGQLVNYNKLSSSLETKYKTIKKYIGYLETSFLIERSNLYSKSKLKGVRKNPKIYVTDHGFSQLQSMDEGPKVETAVYNCLKRSYDVHYWRDHYEVDMIVKKESTIPIEVKYKEEIRKRNLKGLFEFMEKQEVEKAIVVSKEKWESKTYDDKEVIFVPAWLFILI